MNVGGAAAQAFVERALLLVSSTFVCGNASTKECWSIAQSSSTNVMHGSLVGVPQPFSSNGPSSSSNSWMWGVCRSVLSFHAIDHGADNPHCINTLLLSSTDCIAPGDTAVHETTRIVKAPSYLDIIVEAAMRLIGMHSM